MGLFDKKYCEICGEKVNMLTQQKLTDGYLCSDCKHKLGSFTSGWKQRGIDDVKKHLELSRISKSTLSLTAQLPQAAETAQFRLILITVGLFLQLITEIIRAATLRFLISHSFRISGWRRSSELFPIRTATESPTTETTLITDR